VMSAGAAQATLYTYGWNSGFTGGGVIPDGNTAGFTDTRTVPDLFDKYVGDTAEIVDVNVRLRIDGGYNGDLYGYLVHSTGFAVLLNRSGRTGSDPFGYADAGFNITLDGSAATDIHSYGGNSGNQLTGTWQADARNVDPATVTDASSRSAYLSSFNTLDADGSWTLFLADMSGGDVSTLVSWGLDIEVVPEPTTWALIGFTVLFLAVTMVRMLQQRGPARSC